MLLVAPATATQYHTQYRYHTYTAPVPYIHSTDTIHIQYRYHTYTTPVPTYTVPVSYIHSTGTMHNRMSSRNIIGTSQLLVPAKYTQDTTYRDDDSTRTRSISTGTGTMTPDPAKASQ